MNTIAIRLMVNGKESIHEAPADITLADFLHEKIGLTGTKVSCGIGICKACTVGMRTSDQTQLQRIQACLTPAAAVQGYRILTVEGLVQGDQLSTEQLAVLRNFSFQCGYCAPGFLMGMILMIDNLKAQPIHRSELNQTIENHLGQHVCRCSGYVKYYQAVTEVIEQTPGLLIDSA